jgi:hypothetical protein
MSDPPDVHRILDLCMQNINGAREVMEQDMHYAATMLGAAGMMLASAGNAVQRRAAELGQAQPGT